MLTTTPAQLLAATLAATQSTTLEPVYLGTIAVDDFDIKRGRQMAEDRRLFNEESDDPWGNREGRHRGDEERQARTWLEGAIGEAVLGRAYRSAGNKDVRLSPPVEWVPSPEPDLVYSGAQHAFKAGFKSSSYRRANCTTSWTINASLTRRTGSTATSLQTLLTWATCTPNGSPRRRPGDRGPVGALCSQREVRLLALLPASAAWPPVSKLRE